MRPKSIFAALVASLALIGCEETDDRALSPSASTPTDSAPIISAKFPFESHFVEVDGTQVHFVDEGSGPVTYLLLHGMPTSSYLWRNVVPDLVSTGRVIAPDLVGFGKSESSGVEDFGFFTQAAMVEGLIETLKLENVVLVLHDWGSAVGFTYAMNHEANVRGLVFFEAMLAPIPSYDFWQPEVSAFMKAVRNPETSWSLLVDQNVMVEKLLPGMQFRKLSAEELDAYRAPFESVARRKAIYDLVNDLPIGGEPKDVHDAQSNYVAWLEKSTVPKLFLYATPGAATPESMVTWAKGHLTNMKSVHLGDGLHFLQEDHPHWIGAEIVQWSVESGFVAAE